jgi:hypothetical protein
VCMLCELQLFQDHRAVETGPFAPCPECKMFPASHSGQPCYHCFSVGGIVDECPECTGKPWSQEFQQAHAEIEGEEIPKPKRH